MVDFTKGPARLYIINTTPEDLILKSGQIIANLAPIELQESNTYPILGSNTGGSCDFNQLHSLFQESFDGSKRIDKELPLSLFNIVQLIIQEVLPLKNMMNVLIFSNSKLTILWKQKICQNLKMTLI